jgi:hypothetical protein
MGIVRKFADHVLPGVIRPLRVMWNQIVGLLFLALGLGSISPVIRAYRTLQTDPSSMFQFVMSVLFGAVMLYFALSSFWRARKIDRS